MSSGTEPALRRVASRNHAVMPPFHDLSHRRMLIVTTQKNEDIKDANKNISRPDDKARPPADSLAAGRHAVAAKAIAEDGRETSETEKVVERASKNDRRP